MCKQIVMRWLFCNKVNTVLLMTVDLLVKKWRVQEEGSDIDIGENEENEKGSESSKENLWLFSTLQTKD